MNLLFIGYWNVQDPLTTSTILPHLEILATLKGVEKLVFTNTQRLEPDVKAIKQIEATGAIYEPLFSKNLPINHLNKIWDFVYFPRLLRGLVVKYNINKIIARGAPAGALAYLAWKKNKIPFYVESLEPHADYMLDSGVWKKWDPRYIFQKYWEGKIHVYASGLMPVSNNYVRHLIKKNSNLADKIKVVPCSVNLNKFKFNEANRSNIRNKLKIPVNSIIGIYVGKFGGIYYDREAFEIFKKAFDFFEAQFFLIILTADGQDEVKEKLSQVKFTSERYYINKVPFEHVNEYLSAADFAFALYKPGATKKFLCPVKNGEYWSTGLPILIVDDIGDDSEIIKGKDGGAIFNLYEKGSLAIALSKIRIIISEKNHRDRLRKIASENRSFNYVFKAYKFFIES